MSPVLTIVEVMKVKKQTKTKIWVVSFVKAKVGDIEENKKEERIRRMRKEVLGCVHAVLDKERL